MFSKHRQITHSFLKNEILYLTVEILSFYISFVVNSFIHPGYKYKKKLYELEASPSDSLGGLFIHKLDGAQILLYFSASVPQCRQMKQDFWDSWMSVATC